MLIISFKYLDWWFMYSTWPTEDRTNMIKLIVCLLFHPNEIHITIYTDPKQHCSLWFLISYYQLLILTMGIQWPGVSILHPKNMNQWLTKYMLRPKWVQDQMTVILRTRSSIAFSCMQNMNFDRIPIPHYCDERCVEANSSVDSIILLWMRVVVTHLKWKQNRFMRNDIQHELKSEKGWSEIH